MVEESELNVLVSNVLNENRYSHCRLCLKLINEEYVRFKDFVKVDFFEDSYQMVSDILDRLLGEEQLYEKVAGIDAVCMGCMDRAFDALKFIQKCEDSTRTLNSVFDNLAEALTVDINVTDHNSSLLIAVDEHESKLVLINNGIEPKPKKASKTFQCQDCFIEFDTQIELNLHNLENHTILTCTKCNERVENEDELEAHRNSEQTHECQDCESSYCTEESLTRHLNKSHTTYVCKDCGKSFNELDKLHIHEQKHILTNECPKCGKTYNTKHFFLKHVKLCLEDRLDPHPIRSKIQKTYFCEQCGKGYSTPGGLRVHNRFVHGNAKPHVCKICNKQFTAPSYLKTHMIKHTGEKNFKCDLCNKYLVSKEALLYHTRRHTGEKPYSCTMCDEKFVNGSARAEHIKFKHVGPTLMCEICSRKFVLPAFLKQHMKKHYDPSNKLYAGRSLIPPNVPAVENMRIKC